MNILYLINHAGKGGTEKYINEMAKHCLLKGSKLFFAYNEPGLLKEQMESMGAEIFQIPMKSPFDIKAAKSLAKICAKYGINIIHTQFARENYIAILSKRLFNNNARIVHTCHMITENNSIWKLLNKFHMDENYAVIAVCNSVRDKLKENNYPPQKIRLIYNGVKFSEDMSKIGNLRCELGITEEAFIFISLTRFSQEKGVEFLISSAEALLSKNLPFALIIAGDGPLYTESKEYVEKNGLSHIIHLLGYRSDAHSLLSQADCFINSSQSEALSFAILEAMERGLPIIATNVGGNPDIINDTTNCGLLVEYGDITAMSDAMQYMASNRLQAKKMSVNSRNAVKNIFNLDNSIVTTYNIYLEVEHDNR